MKHLKQTLAAALFSVLATRFTASAADIGVWPQWRGANRDGQVQTESWPLRLSPDTVAKLWRAPLGPSYSGCIVAPDLVFTTETRDKEFEVVRAFDRRTGSERWRALWKGSMTVPFFAAANGSWIRSTPAWDGERLYVGGMRDLLVCLDARNGNELWRVDFVNAYQTPLPAFGFVSSPLVDGDALYVQAGASVVRLDKQTGNVRWRALEDSGGMYGSAFSSPVLVGLAGKRQLVVQTRENLAGLDPETGGTLWTRKVPSFRGMNILTPVVIGNHIFTTSYQNKAWLYAVSSVNDAFTVSQAWECNAQGYMSTPVVIDGHVYLHLQNGRFTCIDLRQGLRKWTSQPFGKYVSLVANGSQILGLDQRGDLLLMKANPERFELVDSLKISEEETWAHLAVCGNQLFVRELNALGVYRWSDGDRDE